MSLHRPLSARMPARISTLLVAACMAAALLAVALASLCMGNLAVSPEAAMRALWSAGMDPVSIIVRDLRLPRFITGVLVGASLAVAGALMQGITRNPLADPTLTGVAGIAALAVVGATVLAPAIAASWRPLIALAGAALGATLTFALAWRAHFAPLRLALAGTSVAALGSAGVVALMIAAGPQAGPLFYWLAGGLAGVGWQQAATIAPWTLAGLLLALASARGLNTLALGDAAAESIGLDLRRWRVGLGAVAVALSAAVVAVAGPVGFVGLCVPHLARLIAGADHRAMLPLAALAGGLLVSGADLFARTVAAPRELPVGFLTALLAAPFLIVLIRGGAWRHTGAGEGEGV